MKFNCENVAVTHVSWTSIYTERFDKTTVHFINSEWNLKHVTLNSKKIQGYHTSEYIAESFKRTKLDQGLQHIILQTMLQMKKKNLPFQVRIDLDVMDTDWTQLLRMPLQLKKWRD